MSSEQLKQLVVGMESDLAPYIGERLEVVEKANVAVGIK